MKIQFIGTGSAFTMKNYQTNAIIEHNGERLLIDAGTDVRWSLKEQNLSYKDINALYITHSHSDHIGGIEYLAFTTYFDPSCVKKIQLFGNSQLIKDVWKHSLQGGLKSVQGDMVGIADYFDVQMIQDNGKFWWNDLMFHLVQTVHIYNGYVIVPSYGLMITEPDGRKTFYTGDCQFAPNQMIDFYNEADLIFQDCETAPYKSGVHAHYSELVTLDENIKSKMCLMHYQDNVLNDNDTFSSEWIDNIVKDGFKSIVPTGAIIDTEQVITRQ